MTNWEKYFGTPELAMLTTYDDLFMAYQQQAFTRWVTSKAESEGALIARLADWFQIKHEEGGIAKLYLEWLESEADHD